MSVSMSLSLSDEPASSESVSKRCSYEMVPLCLKNVVTVVRITL